MWFTHKFFTLAICLVVTGIAEAEVSIGVDANGDGYITTRSTIQATSSTADGARIPLDSTSPDQPFIFWVNGDQDNLEEYETWPVLQPDGQTPIIDSARDLEDFSRLRIDFPPGMALRGFVLSIQEELGDPAIGLYRAADTTCSTRYLLQPDAAAQQLSAPFGQRWHLLDASAPAELALVDSERAAGHVCLLFDGATAGVAKIEVHPLPPVQPPSSGDPADPIGEKPDTPETKTFASGNPSEKAVTPPTAEVLARAWLSLRPVKTLYRRARVQWPEEIKAPWDYRLEQPPDPNLNFLWDDELGSYGAPWHTTLDTIIWVYGWQREGLDNYQLATVHVGETVYKRLWHRGYRGELIFFHWPTVKSRFAYGLLHSEYRAYKSAQPLYSLIEQLPKERRLHLTAHSLGNVVLTEALKLGANVQEAVLQQAAIPAGVFDGREELANALLGVKLTPDVANQGGYRGYLEQIKTPLFNLYNVYDYTFVGWNLAQKVMKPAAVGLSRYEYHPDAAPGKEHQLRTRTREGIHVRYVTDPHEILAFMAQSRTQALGAEPKARGFIYNETDVGRSPYSFGSGHVVAWRWNPQRTTEYYNLLLDMFSLRFNSRLR